MKGMFGISLSCALLVAVTITGIGHASQPVRTVNSAPDPFALPLCGFGVLVSPVGQTARTEFSDGRVVRVANADITLTSLADPAQTYFWNTNAHDTQTVLDDATVQFVTNGRILYFLGPGDQGPFGVVGEDGALFGFVGKVTATFDLNTSHVTSLSYEGSATDICAALAA